MAAAPEVTRSAARGRGSGERDGARPTGLMWTLLAVLLGGVFVYAGALKVVDPLRLANDISNYHIVPWPVGVRMAFYLPWLEILCGLAVITGMLRRGGVAILSALTFVFIAASVAAKTRGIDVSCGCFGAVSEKLTFTTHLLLDLAIFAGLAALWRHLGRITNRKTDLV